MLEPRLERPWQVLRLTYGLIPIVAGLDKFTNLLADWEGYLSPLARSLLPVSAPVFMRAVGVIEIAVGILVLTRLVRVGASVAAAWLALIALNLLASGKHLDVAVRDLAMAAGAWTLARFAELREQASAPAAGGLPASAQGAAR